MKRDYIDFCTINAGEEIKPPKGYLHIISDQAVKVMGTVHGVSTLIGVGTEIRYKGKLDTVQVIAPPKTQVFLYSPARECHRPTGERFTNIDRMPFESSNLMEVKRATRSFQLEQKMLRNQLKNDALEARTAMQALLAEHRQEQEFRSDIEAGAEDDDEDRPSKPEISPEVLSGQN